MERKEKLKLKHRSSRRVVASFVVCAWLFGGCASPVLDPVPVRESSQGTRLQLQVEEPDTKVEVADATGKCTWTPSATMPDTIAVWVSGSDNKYEDCIVNKDDISSSGTVGSVVLQSDQPRSRYAVYPASAAVSAASGSDDGSVNPQVSYNTHYDLSQLEASLVNDYTRLPMVAKNSDNTTPTLAFFHVGGMLRLSLKGIPSGATVVEVSFEGMDHVTGTYEVLEGGTVGGRTKGAPVSGKGNRVLFTLPSASVSSGSCVVNVPLPCGDYGTLTGVRVKAGTQERVKYAAWPFITHAMGKKLECDFNTPVGPIDRLVLGTDPDATLWKGQKVTRQARAYDANGNEVTGVSVAWSSGNTAVATVNPSTGEVTAASAGEAVITATATAGSVTKTASYTVYVNELTGLVLDCGSTLTLRLGVSKPVTATAVYTMNGDPEPPVVNWYVTGPASPAKTATASGTANRFTALSQGSGTITAKIEKNTYGTHPVLVATCNFDAIPVTYLPGKFSVSPTEQVYFSPGNLQVNYTGTSGGGHTREWLFSENQWDVFFLTEDELNSLPNPPAGTTVKLSHFGWGTAGHKNPGGDYGYDENHLHYEPHSNSSQEYKYCPSTATWWLKTSGNPNIGYLTLKHEKNTWNADPELRSYCDWGIHFDDNGVGHDDKYDGTWFTLSYRQWLYLAQERSSAKEKISSALLVVDNAAEIKIPGLVLVPDDWQCPAGCEFDYMAFALGGTHEGAEYYYAKNVYYINTTWPLMEASGAVFLPVAGYRYHQPSNGQLYNPSPVWGTSPYYNTQGSYWTSTAEATSSNISQAPTMGFHSTGILGNLQYQHQARAVRLVHYAN